MVLRIFSESISSDQNNEPKKFVWLSTSLHLIHWKNAKPEGHELPHARLLCALEVRFCDFF